MIDRYNRNGEMVPARMKEVLMGRQARTKRERQQEDRDQRKAMSGIRTMAVRR